MKTVHLRQEAEEDLYSAAHWYEHQHKGLGQRFLDETRSTFHRISQHPALYPVVTQNVRRVLTHHFPFAIYYCVTDTDIVVIGVLHCRRDPVIWKRRIE